MAMKQRIHIIRVTLNGSKPPIWRKLTVPSDIVLGELHEVIQIAMGWTNSHLHRFDQRVKISKDERIRLWQKDSWTPREWARLHGGRKFVTKVTPWGEPTEMEGEDEEAVTLGEVCPKVKNSLIYEYDFGDGWEHAIEVQKIIEPEPGVQYPVCLGGKKACPPEDCGGICGYYELLETISDPEADDHDDMLEWLGGDFDPDAFNLDEVNATLAEWRDQKNG